MDHGAADGIEHSAPGETDGAALVFVPGVRESAVKPDGGGIRMEVAMPHLHGPSAETLFTGGQLRQAGSWWLLDDGRQLAGAAVARPDEPPREAAQRLYTELLAQLGGRHLHRIWNCIPAINACRGGEENYRAFNAGRLAAFHAHAGPDFRRLLPAASALGTGGRVLAIAFTAGEARPLHFENPAQVPACDYPPEYGARPPAFARGTRIAGEGRDVWHLAGTASIRGHRSTGETCEEQARLTLENLHTMRRLMDVPAGAGGRWKIFVRRPDDAALCRRLFLDAWPDAAAGTMVLAADICRAELLVEIEGAVSLAAAPAALTVSPAASA